MQAIQEYSSANQSSYFPSEDNPSDGTPAGVIFKNFINFTTQFQGPALLWEPHSSWGLLDFKTQIKMVSLILNRRGR